MQSYWISKKKKNSNFIINIFPSLIHTLFANSTIWDVPFHYFLKTKQSELYWTYVLWGKPISRDDAERAHSILPCFLFNIKLISFFVIAMLSDVIYTLIYFVVVSLLLFFRSRSRSIWWFTWKTIKFDWSVYRKKIEYLFSFS